MHHPLALQLVPAHHLAALPQPLLHGRQGPASPLNIRLLLAYIRMAIFPLWKGGSVCVGGGGEGATFDRFGAELEAVITAGDRRSTHQTQHGIVEVFTATIQTPHMACPVAEIQPLRCQVWVVCQFDAFIVKIGRAAHAEGSSCRNIHLPQVSILMGTREASF